MSKFDVGPSKTSLSVRPIFFQANRQIEINGMALERYNLLTIIAVAKAKAIPIANEKLIFVTSINNELVEYYKEIPAFVRLSLPNPPFYTISTFHPPVQVAK